MPLRNDLPAYRFKLDLSGTVYTLAFRYNTRMQRWIMDLMDASGTPLIMGSVLLLRTPLLNRFVIDELPPGVLLAYDDTDKDTQPTRNSFDNDHSLLYVDP
jgi:hypothetical protein